MPSSYICSVKIVCAIFTLFGFFMTLRLRKKYSITNTALGKEFIHQEWDKDNPIMVKDYGDPIEEQRLEAKPEPLTIRESRNRYNNILGERNRLYRSLTNWIILTIVFLILTFK